MTRACTKADLERIARQLGGGRKNGGGWDCRCPAHDDQEPSLSLSVGEDGRLLWCCHTGCDQAAVLDGLKKRGVLVNGDAREAEPKAAKGRIISVYDYLDERGELLFPAIVTESSLGYYREFLAREALRHVEHEATS